jgi:hypothetical protein
VEDIELEYSNGEKIQMRAFCGKPSLLVIEGIESLSQNELFKQELRRVATANPDLAAKVNLIAVADFASLRGSPASTAAVAAVTLAQQKEPGVRILIDWLGQVNTKFTTKASKSNVFVLSADFRPILGFQGTLAAAQIKLVLDKLHSQIK